MNSIIHIYPVNEGYWRKIPVERRGKLQEVRYHSDDEKAGKNKHLVKKKKLLSTKMKTAFIYKVEL